MNKILSLAALSLLTTGTISAQESATLKLTDTTLMHEMRVIPSPKDGATISDRAISFQWALPDGFYSVRSGLDGLAEKEPQKGPQKESLLYVLRYSQNINFPEGSSTMVNTRWPFFNPEKDLSPGRWYWQYGYVNNGKTQWSPCLQFTVETNPQKFCPPSLNTVLSKLPTHHPRVWLDRSEWDSFIKRSIGSPDRDTYIKQADKVLRTPMKSVNDINVSLVKGLNSEMQRNAMLTRESRRIIDSEEANTDVLIRAYLLTKEKRYADEAIKRVKIMATWGDNKNVLGDFNDATLLSLCSMAYDAMYDQLDSPTRHFLLKEIKKHGNNMFQHNNNRLENHIADNHVWQMTFRIFTMAAFTVYGELPEAKTWTDYCYNLWLARFPGLNKDGAWHNGDSYFHVNLRTLVEVPFFYSRLTGFNYFTDPWYQGNARYVIYQQPPFSKSGGNGSSHQNILTPSGPRVSYADALAKMTGNTYAADYVRHISNQIPDILSKESTSKAGGLAWFRLQCNKPLPTGAGLKDLPMGCVFPQSGLASFSTDLDNTPHSAMLSFRSSPYGSTSHALANQNAFNTFWNGQPLFYSSGHHISFVDKHSICCHRATRAHNSILVNGMGQRIGTEGYGWIPRHYVGKEISYVVGDASNAYGKVISPLWLQRAKDADLDFSPANGWDETGLKKFRRHIVTLGTSGYTFIYDELEAEKPVTWSYLLHTITNPMSVDKKSDFVHIQATSKDGISDAYLFAAGELKTDTTHQFFVPAVNWLRADDKGNFKSYPNHWHFTATSEKQQVYRFATIIYTHAKSPTPNPSLVKPERLQDGKIRIGNWIIQANTSTQGVASFSVYSQDQKTSINYQEEGVTLIEESGKTTRLKDEIPELEI